MMKPAILALLGITMLTMGIRLIQTKGNTRTRIYFIGVLHGMVPDEDLLEVLKYNHPDLVLIEEPQQNVENGNFTNSHREMKVAYEWAMQNSIRVYGIDPTERDILRRPLPSKLEIEQATSAQLNVLAGRTWKETNQSEVAAAMMEAAGPIIDMPFHYLRQRLLLEQIYLHLNEGLKILVFVGSAHLDFMQKNLPQAIFPLRK